MANVFTGAIAQHAVALRNNAGQTVTYRRGGLSVSLAATPCDSRAEVDLQFGVLNLAPKDWIITASLLVLNSVTVTPQKNNTIEESDGTIWQVLSDGVEPPWRYSGPTQDMLRIHTKRIDAG
jgi:hypothetical protein